VALCRFLCPYFCRISLAPIYNERLPAFYGTDHAVLTLASSSVDVLPETKHLVLHGLVVVDFAVSDWKASHKTARKTIRREATI
jgi:hypothetical protein